MGENILIFVLGVLTKIIWDRINQKRIQKGKDRKTLTKVRNTLTGFKAIYESNRRDKTSAEYLDELHGLSFEIQLKKNKDIAYEIEKFVQENEGRDPTSYPALRAKIISLKEKVEERLRQEGG